MATKFGKLFGTDTLLGTDNDDLLIALGAKTTLDGGAGNDILIGGVNDDILIGGKGADVLIGGLGNDTADYSKSDAGVTVDLTTGRGYGGDAQGDTLFSIENIIGSAHDDVLKGDRGSNVMTGGDGADVFVMTTGKDTITDFKPTVSTVDKVIDFNDLPVSGPIPQPVPDGYGGLNWSGVRLVSSSDPSWKIGGTGDVGKGSPILLYDEDNRSEASTLTTAGANFSLKSAYMAAEEATAQVTIQGWDGGVLKATQTFELGLNYRTLVNFVGFDSIDKLTIVATDVGLSRFFYVAIDDITLAFDGAPGDKIRADTPLGMTVDQMIANAVSDGHGGTLLKYQGGQLDLQGIAPHDVKAEWFV